MADDAADDGIQDTPSDGRRSGGFPLWAARHPILSALLCSVLMTLLIFAKSALFAMSSGRSVHLSHPSRPSHSSHSSHPSVWRLWIGAGVVEAILFAMFAGLTLFVARSRRRSGIQLTAEGLDLPFVEDRGAAAHRPPPSLVLRPGMRHPFGLLLTLPLLAGVLSLIAGAADTGSGRRAVVWIVMAPLWLAAGAWTITGHRRQRIVVDSDHVYVYTFTGRYRRIERSRIMELRRTKAEPILVDGDGERLATLPLGLTRAQVAELAQVLQVAGA